MKLMTLVAIATMFLLACKADVAAPAGQPAASKSAATSSPSRIDGAKARELVSAGAVLLDVRTQAEFDGGHLDGAKLIAVQELAGRIGEVGPKNEPVVIYCASGRRSNRAATMLAEAGYQKVYDLGPKSAW